MHAYVYNHRCLTCVLLVRYISQLPIIVLVLVAPFTHTLFSLFIQLYHYTSKWCGRETNVEHSVDQLHVAEHIENAALRLF